MKNNINVIYGIVAFGLTASIVLQDIRKTMVDEWVESLTYQLRQATEAKSDAEQSLQEAQSDLRDEELSRRAADAAWDSQVKALDAEIQALKNPRPPMTSLKPE